MPVTNQESSLGDWLKAKGLQVDTGTGAEWTHSSLAGGLFNIRCLKKFLDTNSAKGRVQRDVSDLTPAEKDARYRQQELQFLKHYGRTTANILFRKVLLTGSTADCHRSLPKDKLNFISEKITPVFKYFIDLDFACDSLENAYGYSTEALIKPKIDKLTKRVSAYRAGGSRTHAGMLSKTVDKLERYNLIYNGLNHARLLAKVRLIQNTLRDFYPALEARNPRAFSAMVCLTKPKDLKNKGYGEGVHIIFPYILVNNDQALNLRETLVSKLETEFPLLNTKISNWRKVFDGDVYGENKGALRMLGSRKAEHCQCNKKKNRTADATPIRASNCRICNGNYYVWTSRIYWPEYWLSSKGELMTDELRNLLNPNVMIAANSKPGTPRRKDNLFRLMQLASLRTFASQPLPEFSMPVGAVRHVPVRVSSRKSTRKGSKKTGNGAADDDPEEARMHEEDAKTLSSLKSKRLFARDHPWIPLFEKLISRKFGTFYDKTKVSQVFSVPSKKAKSHPWFLICVSGPGSNYCLNLGGDHASNTVYFIVSESGILQKCHCKCDVARPSGTLCRNYVSETKSLADTPIFYGILFPPLYHGTVWTMPTTLKYGKMPIGYTDVLYNRMTRLKPISLTNRSPDDVEGRDSEPDIAQGDSTLNEETIQKIITEILGSDPAAKPAPANVLVESQLHGNAPIDPEPYAFMVNAQTEI